MLQVFAAGHVTPKKSTRTTFSLQLFEYTPSFRSWTQYSKEINLNETCLTVESDRKFLKKQKPESPKTLKANFRSGRENNGTKHKSFPPYFCTSKKDINYT